jgi:hypothetical protein
VGPTTCSYFGVAPPPEPREHLLRAWTVGGASGGTETVLPDGSIDIVWPQGLGPAVAGPDTAGAEHPPTEVEGGLPNFRPGAAPAMLGIPADRLRDLRVPLSEAWGRDAERLEASLDGAGSASARAHGPTRDAEAEKACPRRRGAPPARCRRRTAAPGRSGAVVGRSLTTPRGSKNWPLTQLL